MCIRDSNATDFGDLTNTPFGVAAASNETRSVFAGSSDGSGLNNVIQYITTATTGNATDFGDLLSISSNAAGCSGT